MTRVRAVLFIFAAFALTSSVLGLSAILTSSFVPYSYFTVANTESSATAGAAAGTAETSTTTATATTNPSPNGSASSLGTMHNASNTPSFQASVSSLQTLTQVAPTPLQVAQRISVIVAPASWIMLAGAWIWRGRVKARWTQLGFESDVFELFMKMRGGVTRIKLLSKLDSPKDRLQLAQELGLDWKAVDRHVRILNKYGFVKEEAVYGSVRMYQTTSMGKVLLDLFSELEREDGATRKLQAQRMMPSYTGASKS